MTTTYPNRATPANRQVDYAAPAPVDAVQTPYLMAACVSLGALILYIATLAPTTQFWDTSEYIAAAYTLGIPHPPGNPLFTLIAHVWGLIPWVAGYAMRINLFAAATSAVSAGCWFLVGERWLRSIVPATWPRRLAALAGAMVSATAFTVWNQSVVNEKVYTLSLLSLGLESATPVMLAGALFIAALVYATLVAGNVSFGLAALLVAVVGLSVYVYLPIRAGF